MDKEQQKYFNFPIVLLEGFLEDGKSCLRNIFDYAIYDQIERLKDKEGFEWLAMNEDETKAVEVACSYFGITTGNKEQTYINGMQLYDSIQKRTPKTKISVDVWLEFYQNSDKKSKKVKLYLLAHLALLSTNKGKPYTKVTKDYLYSRMDGKVKSFASNFEDEKLIFPDPRIKEFLSKELQTFFTKRHWINIKNALTKDWHWFIPKKRPVMNNRGVLEVKQIKRVNYFTQLDEETFFKGLIKEEENKYEKRKKEEGILGNLVSNHNQKNVPQNVQL